MRGTRRFPDLNGGMAAVGLSREETEAYITQVSSGKVLAACINSPSSVTVSGDLAGIKELQALLEKDNVFVRQLNVDAGYHSHHMNVVADEYRALLGQLPTEDAFGDIAYWSSVTGDRVNDGTTFGTEYWVTNMIQPVLFTYALQKMCLNSDRKGKLAVDALVEVGPHSALAGPIRQALTLPELKGFPIPYTSCLVRKQDAVRTMQELACALYRIGYPVDLAAVNQLPDGLQVVTDLPPYPWNHKIRHWQEPRLSKDHRERKYGHHDLLGLPFTSVNMTKTWRHIIRPSEIPWVRDHIIQSDIVYPGAGYISMAIEAIRQGLDETDVKGYKLRDVNITSAVIVPDTVDGAELFISLSPCANKLPGAQNWREFHISSVSENNVWTEHCSGYISIEYKSASERSPSLSHHSKVDKMTEGCVRRVQSKDVYDSLHALGIRHGPAFQNLEEIRVGREESVAVLSVADTVALMPSKYQHDHVIHPTTLDTVFQAMHPILAEEQHAAMIPKSFQSIFVSRTISSAPGHRFKVCSELKDQQLQSIKASIFVVNEDDADDVVIQVDGLVCGSIGMTGGQDSQTEKRRLCFQMRWAPDISFPLSSGFLSSIVRRCICPPCGLT
jgi:acyl transferase domain-containing protein